MSKNKEEAIKLIRKKLNNDSYLTYEEIAEITNYHPKYIFKLVRLIKNDTIKLEHGNKSKKPANAISEAEKNKIITLYNKSSVSIRKFCKFYNTISYSCIYNIIMEEKKEKK